MSVLVPEPAEDGAALISDRIDAGQERPENPVGTPQGKYHVEWVSRRDGDFPTVQHFRQRLGIVHRLPAPALRLIGRSACILIPFFIIPKYMSVGVGHPCQLRDVVGQGMKLCFALTQYLLGLHPLGDVAGDLGEADDPRGLIDDGRDHAADEETAAVLAEMPAFILAATRFG